MPKVTHVFLYSGVEGKSNTEIRAHFSDLKKLAIEDGAKEVRLEIICHGKHTGHWVFSQVFNNGLEYGAATDKWAARWGADESAQTMNRWKSGHCIDLIQSSATYEEILT